MWALENRTPFSADRAFQRGVDGGEVWVVVVRATYCIRPGGHLELASEQFPVARGVEYFDEPGISSLRYETDLVLSKRTTDVLLHGHAYAPGGEPAKEIVASLTVGPVNKVFRVVGDRQWVRTLGAQELTSPLPFTKMPLMWERAFGGVDPACDESAAKSFEPRNPIGTGFASKGVHPEGQRAPNVLHIKDEASPVCLGPVARDWQPRVDYAGTYDGVWQETRAPLLPLDFDERFFQCAPADQQTPEFLRGGERVVLYNLHPNSPLIFELPTVQLGFSTEFRTKTVAHRAVLHTVIIEPDLERVQMVWHTRLECHHDVHGLRRTIVTEGAVESEDNDDAETLKWQGPNRGDSPRELESE